MAQGTVATDFDDLIRPALSALQEERVLVLATTGNRDVSTIGMSPPNALLSPFVPFDRVMPFVDVIVTNGGYGGFTSPCPTACHSSWPVRPTPRDNGSVRCEAWCCADGLNSPHPRVDEVLGLLQLCLLCDEPSLTTLRSAKLDRS